MFLVSSYGDDGIVRAKQGRLMKMKQSSRSEDCPRGTKEGPGLIRRMFWTVLILFVACSDGLGSIAIGAKEALKRCVSIAVSMMTN
jgi:hypothetical protein